MSHRPRFIFGWYPVDVQIALRADLHIDQSFLLVWYRVGHWNEFDLMIGLDLELCHTPGCRVVPVASIISLIQ